MHLCLGDATFILWLIEYVQIHTVNRVYTNMGPFCTTAYLTSRQLSDGWSNCCLYCEQIDKKGKENSSMLFDTTKSRAHFIAFIELTVI